MKISHLIAAAVTISAIIRPPSLHAQGGRAGHMFGAWQNMAWSAIEVRVRCDGGPVGTNSGPINWTVQFHNRANTPASFDYQLSNASAEQRGAAPTAGRTTVKPNRVFEKPISLRTDSCEETPSIGLNKVRFGADADSVPYALPDRR
jgi:hypothetical protein